jgi:hypothetical protein
MTSSFPSSFSHNAWYKKAESGQNRVFKSYDNLVDHRCEAWNKLVDLP